MSEPVKIQVTVPLTEKEWQVLLELSQKQDLSPDRVMVQGLRLNQGVQSGHWKLVETDPLPMVMPDFTPIEGEAAAETEAEKGDGVETTEV